MKELKRSKHIIMSSIQPTLSHSGRVKTFSQQAILDSPCLHVQINTQEEYSIGGMKSFTA